MHILVEFYDNTLVVVGQIATVHFADKNTYFVFIQHEIQTTFM